MKLPLSFLALGAMCTAPSAAYADTSADMTADFENRSGGNSRSNSGGELPPYLQCVPFAREVSGIQIFGDARTWWDQAEGRYQRSRRPQVGAVMAFQPHRNMTLGHVAAVSKVIDSRTVLISHSNWSPINGRRGQIERNVRAEDVSPGNDWSEVRVWYDPLQAVGNTAWPVHGFIYGTKARGGSNVSADATRIARAALPVPVTPEPSKKFSRAFSDLGAPTVTVATQTRAVASAAPQPVRIARVAVQPAPRRSDPVRDAIARYEQ